MQQVGLWDTEEPGSGFAGGRGYCIEWGLTRGTLDSSRPSVGHTERSKLVAGFTNTCISCHKALTALDPCTESIGDPPHRSLAKNLEDASSATSPR